MKAEPESKNDVSYSLLLFGLAAVAFSVHLLAKIGGAVSNFLAMVIVFLAGIVSVAGIVHFWRYGMHK